MTLKWAIYPLIFALAFTFMWSALSGAHAAAEPSATIGESRQNMSEAMERVEQSYEANKTRLGTWAGADVIVDGMTSSWWIGFDFGSRNPTLAGTMVYLAVPIWVGLEMMFLYKRTRYR